MEFPRIALKVGQKQFNKLVDLSNRVGVSLAGNENFTEVTPSLTILEAGNTAVVDALSVWGQKGSRGSHADYVDLCNKAQNLLLILKEVAQYVSNTSEQAAGTDYALMASIMTTSGFTLAQAKSAQGPLQAIRNFRVLISLVLNRNQVKLKWNRPLNTLTTDAVSSYEVLRSETADFSTAVTIAITNKGEFIDTNSSPAAVTWYYWVVPYNAAGAGATSSVLQVMVLSA